MATVINLTRTSKYKGQLNKAIDKLDTLNTGIGNLRNGWHIVGKKRENILTYLKNIHETTKSNLNALVTLINSTPDDNVLSKRYPEFEKYLNFVTEEMTSIEDVERDKTRVLSDRSFIYRDSDSKEKTLQIKTSGTYSYQLFKQTYMLSFNYNLRSLEYEIENAKTEGNKFLLRDWRESTNWDSKKIRRGVITAVAVVALGALIGGLAWTWTGGKNKGIDEGKNAVQGDLNSANSDYASRIENAKNNILIKYNTLAEDAQNWNTKANGEEALVRLNNYYNALSKLNLDINSVSAKFDNSQSEVEGEIDNLSGLNADQISEKLSKVFFEISSETTKLVAQTNDAELNSKELVDDLISIEKSVKEDLVKSYSEDQLTKIDFSSVLPGSFKVEKVEIDFGEETDNIKIYSVRRSVNGATGRVQAENCLETYTAENIKKYFDDDNEITDKELQEIVSKIDLKSLKTYTDYSYLKDFYDVTRVYISDADIATAMVANKENCEINVQVVKKDNNNGEVIFSKTYSYNNNGKDKTNSEIIESILSAVKTNYDSPMKTNVTVNDKNLNNYASPYELFAAMEEEK